MGRSRADHQAQPEEGGGQCRSPRGKFNSSDKPGLLYGIRQTGHFVDLEFNRKGLRPASVASRGEPRAKRAGENKNCGDSEEGASGGA